VIVQQRERTSDGRWWYACVALLCGRSSDALRPRVTVAPIPITVAAEYLSPIPGEEYTGVPTAGAESGRQWLAVRARGVAARGPSWVVHHRSCWQSRAGAWRQQLVTTDRARQILADGSHVCDVCRPDLALHPLTPPR